MEDVKKITFFKRLKIALIDLEEYVKFLGERFSKAIGFVFKISILLAFIFSIANIAYFFINYQSVESFIADTVPEFSIQEGKIEINNQEKMTDEKKETVQMMEQFNQSANLFMIEDGYNRDRLAQDIRNNLGYIIFIAFLGIFLANFIDLVVFWLLNAIMTSVIGEIILLMSRIKMRYSSVYAISIYASTLSMILTVIYSIARLYFNVYIDIFDYLYMIISYIYITAVILMIRAELIKQQIEIIKIVSQKKQDKKEKEEIPEKKEEKKKEDKEEKDKNPSDDNLEEPDGSEI